MPNPRFEPQAAKRTARGTLVDLYQHDRTLVLKLLQAHNLLNGVFAVPIRRGSLHAQARPSD